MQATVTGKYFLEERFANTPLEPLQFIDVPFQCFIYIAFHFQSQNSQITLKRCD